MTAFEGSLAAYQALVEAGELKADTDQAAAAKRLQRLYRELADYPAVPSPATRVRQWRLVLRPKRINPSVWEKWTTKLLNLWCDSNRWEPSVGIAPLARLFRWSGRDAAYPRGIYLWGGVGRGKSMLMDLFFAAAPIKAKRRVHFHQFMLEVHEAIHRFRAMSPSQKIAFGAAAGSDDPIPPVARKIAVEASLLCFDEMQVGDVADAGILGRLFAALHERGVVVVATANRPPHELYKDGLNRAIILPFIALIEREWDVLPLNGPTDYRLARLSGVKVYHVPNGRQATAALREAFFRLTDHCVDDAHKVPSEEIEVQGRALFVPKSLKGVAVFSFKRLCMNPLGAADYLAIARRYHSVIIVGVPCMSKEMRNEAKRFTTLIDALYEYKVKLLMAADAMPEALYPAGDGAFEFARAVSRLNEMQSHAYLALGHGGP
ncbi:MAG: cell division protein ZapE [Pseudomonadota bacterium]